MVPATNSSSRDCWYATPPVILQPLHPGPCHPVDSVQEAILSLKTISDLQLLGAELSVNPHTVDSILAIARNAEHKQIELIQAWYQGSARVCWEHVVKALAGAGEKDKARIVASKYDCEWSED